MLGLVSPEKTSSLGLGSGSPGKFLVEIDDTLHLDGIRCSAKSLRSSYQHLFMPFSAGCPMHPASPVPLYAFPFLQSLPTLDSTTECGVDEKGLID